MIAYTFIGQPNEYLPGIPAQSLDADELPALAAQLGLTERKLTALLDASPAYRKRGTEEPGAARTAATKPRAPAPKKKAPAKPAAQLEPPKPEAAAAPAAPPAVEPSGPYTPVSGDEAPPAEPKRP